MKAAIYNPYLDTLGGGERYTVLFAKVLTEFGFDVDVEWKEVDIKKKLESRFGVKLAKINIVTNVNRGDRYDLLFWVSDGSIPTLLSRKNLLHFQVPFHDLGGVNLLNKMKLFRINKIICNSFFTKRFIDREYGVQSEVIYPPVDVEQIKPKRKENIILSVGRFSKLLQSKKQDFLVSAFKNLVDSGMGGWKLILAGGIEVGSDNFVDYLKKISSSYPIDILPSPDFDTLKSLYGKAKIFWSAAGYGEDEQKNPEKVEHFGLALLEAMTAGGVPLVFNAGGHKEIIKNMLNGYLWSSQSQLLGFTKDLIENKTKLKTTSKQSIVTAKNFSYLKFKQQCKELLL